MTSRDDKTSLPRAVLMAALLAWGVCGPTDAQWAWDGDVGWIRLGERPPETENGRYAYARALFIQGYFAGAYDAFAEFEKSYPGSPLAAKSALNRARCRERLGRAREAAEIAAELAVRATADNATRSEAAALLLDVTPRLDRRSAQEALVRLDSLDAESLPVAARARLRQEQARRRLQLGDYAGAREAALAATTMPAPSGRAEAWLAAGMADLIACRVQGHDDERVRRAAAAFRESGSAAAREAQDIAESILAEPDAQKRAVYYAATLLYEREFEAAARVFKAAAKKYKGTSVGEMAAYYRGETAFGAEDWSEAFNLYERCVKDYPATRRMRALVEREFEIGRALDRAGDASLAIRAMEAVAQNYPLGALADDAYMYAGQAHMARGDWFEAKSAFDVVVYGHPRSEWNTAALFLGGKCDLKQTDLARDNDVLLMQARRAFELYLRTDPRGRFAEEAQTLLAECREKQAAALMDTAAMYLRRKEKRAALVYYDYAVSHYPDSASAGPARAALGALKDEGVALKWMDAADK